MSLTFNSERVLTNVRLASTEDLLERVTAFRAELEPEAIDIIEAELDARHVSQAEIAAAAQHWREQGLHLPDGSVARCSLCRRPAVGERLGWHRLFGRVPVFPRWLRYCAEHRPV
jgi:hypothetical protein